MNNPKDGHGTHSVADQQTALCGYLQALLNEVPVPVAETAPSPSVQSVGEEKGKAPSLKPAAKRSLPVSKPEPREPRAAATITPGAAAQSAQTRHQADSAPPSPPPLAEMPVAPKAGVSAVSPDVPASDPIEVVTAGAQATRSAARAEPPVEGDRPTWAAAPFQSLLFKLGALTLSVPLTKLAGVIHWRAVTPMPNHSSHFLGLIHHHERQVKVVDTSGIVIPDAAQRPDGAEAYSHIVLLEGGEWGLACNGIGEVLSLRPDEIRWRSSRGSRPWLAGTVMQHLCALLDVDGLRAMLDATPRN